MLAEKQNKNTNTKHKNLRNRDKHKSNKTTENGSVQENGKSVPQSKNIKKKTGTVEQQYKQQQNGGHVQLSKNTEKPQDIKVSLYLFESFLLFDCLGFLNICNLYISVYR